MLYNYFRHYSRTINLQILPCDALALGGVVLGACNATGIAG
jgi:hypothetical protein